MTDKQGKAGEGQHCPKCGYAGIGPCSCEYKSAQPAQLSADGPRLQSAREFLMSIDADDYGGCGRVTVEDLVKLLEAYASAVAQRELPEEKPDTNHPNTSYQLPEKFSKVFKPSPPEADIAATQEEPEK